MKPKPKNQLRENISEELESAGVYEKNKFFTDVFLSLIQSEIQACLPKKKSLGKNYFFYNGMTDEMIEGYNACLSDIQEKLKERGLI